MFLCKKIRKIYHYAMPLRTKKGGRNLLIYMKQNVRHKRLSRKVLLSIYANQVLIIILLYRAEES